MSLQKLLVQGSTRLWSIITSNKTAESHICNVYVARFDHINQPLSWHSGPFEWNDYHSMVGVCPFHLHSIKVAQLNIWYQINAHCHPVWASLAADFLYIMASSVSSEHAFSAAGLTITKHWNQLPADVVEALQFLKCMYQHDLILWESASSAMVEGVEGVGERKNTSFCGEFKEFDSGNDSDCA